MKTDTLHSDYQRHLQAEAKAIAHTQATVFDALAAAGVTSVYAGFAGAGDNCQVKAPIARTGDAQVPLPKTAVSMETVPWGASGPVLADTPLADAIETLCYDYLAQEHSDWGDEEGAFGEFLFDVAERKITLLFNKRYSSSLLYTSTF